jgi:hypothetical protein
MKPFVGHAASQEFVSVLSNIAAGLPATGDPLATEFIALAHYSEDPEIELFQPRMGYPTWTDIVSQSQSHLEKVTGLSAKRFQAVYVIRLGLPMNHQVSDYVNHNCSGPNCSEYAIGYQIPSTHFVCVPITASDGLFSCTITPVA